MKSQHTTQTKTSENDRASQVNATAKSVASPPLHPMLHLQQQVGNQAVGRLIQAKLTVGEPNDVYEQEADRVAAEVVRQIHTPKPPSASQTASVQRQVISNEGLELRTKPLIQSKSDMGGVAVSSEIESSIQQARGSGQPLTEGIRRPMEQAFGADFSGVRVHTDERSDRLNRWVQALAFTTGQDVFFRQGAYQTGSRGGQELLAHELTHVVQQGYSGNMHIQMMQANDSGTVQNSSSYIFEFLSLLKSYVLPAWNSLSAKLWEQPKDATPSPSTKLTVEPTNLLSAAQSALLTDEVSQKKQLVSVHECPVKLDGSLWVKWLEKMRESLYQAEKGLDRVVAKEDTLDAEIKRIPRIGKPINPNRHSQFIGTYRGLASRSRELQQSVEQCAKNNPLPHASQVSHAKGKQLGLWKNINDNGSEERLWLDNRAKIIDTICLLGKDFAAFEKNNASKICGWQGRDDRVLRPLSEWMSLMGFHDGRNTYVKRFDQLRGFFPIHITVPNNWNSPDNMVTNERRRLETNLFIRYHITIEAHGEDDERNPKFHVIGGQYNGGRSQNIEDGATDQLFRFTGINNLNNLHEWVMDKVIPADIR
jgi:Domain of unknown function (DUF4157)